VNQALILSGPDIPKYGGGLLQKANSLGSATYGDHIADVSPVFELFVQQNSELSYPDWVDFYQETRDAEKELTGATNLLRKYMTRLRDTADGILEDELCREWAEDMVYRRPFQGFTREREIADHFRRKYGFDCRVTSTHREESKGINLYLGTQPVSVKPTSYITSKADNVDDGIPIVYYENKLDQVREPRFELYLDELVSMGVIGGHTQTELIQNQGEYLAL